MIPKIEITDNERLWLREAWRILLETGAVPEYKTLRKNTAPATGTDFSPYNISKFLLNNHATEITFLGVLHADPDSSILKDAERILLYIQKGVWEDGHSGEFIMKDLAKELGLKVKYVKIVFGLMSEFGDIYDGARSDVQPATKYQYDVVTVSGDHVFDAYIRFKNIEQKITDHYYGLKDFQKENAAKTKGERRIGSGALWMDASGNLHMPATKFGHFDFRNTSFINPSRIKELAAIESADFDFLKLLNLCKEINFNYIYGNYYAVALLTRGLIDHVPPIFKFRTFEDVVNNYNAENNVKSFRASMKHLDNSLRNIGDSLVHSMIRKSEVAPNETQIDFKNDIDVLLAEIVRILK